MKYVIYALTGALILWSAGYLIYDFHRRLKGKRGCGSGGTMSTLKSCWVSPCSPSSRNSL